MARTTRRTRTSSQQNDNAAIDKQVFFTQDGTEQLFSWQQLISKEYALELLQRRRTKEVHLPGLTSPCVMLEVELESFPRCNIGGTTLTLRRLDPRAQHLATSGLTFSTFHKASRGSRTKDLSLQARLTHLSAIVLAPEDQIRNLARSAMHRSRAATTNRRVSPRSPDAVPAKADANFNVSHRCGNARCLSPAHVVVEPNAINLSREVCLQLPGKETCRHEPRCLVEDVAVGASGAGTGGEGRAPREQQEKPQKEEPLVVEDAQDGDDEASDGDEGDEEDEIELVEALALSPTTSLKRRPSSANPCSSSKRPRSSSPSPAATPASSLSSPSSSPTRGVTVIDLTRSDSESDLDPPSPSRLSLPTRRRSRSRRGSPATAPPSVPSSRRLQHIELSDSDDEGAAACLPRTPSPSPSPTPSRRATYEEVVPDSEEERERERVWETPGRERFGERREVARAPSVPPEAVAQSSTPSCSDDGGEGAVAAAQERGTLEEQQPTRCGEDLFTPSSRRPTSLDFLPSPAEAVPTAFRTPPPTPSPPPPSTHQTLSSPAKTPSFDLLSSAPPVALAVEHPLPGLQLARPPLQQPAAANLLSSLFSAQSLLSPLSTPFPALSAPFLSPSPPPTRAQYIPEDVQQPSFSPFTCTLPFRPPPPINLQATIQAAVNGAVAGVLSSLYGTTAYQGQGAARA
ncbi:hypothetical protein JCM6882_001735 [Rhodosporidiobolus microsporus]